MNEQTQAASCLELVARMAKHFDPQAARGQEAEIQFIFSGEENERCFLRMKKDGCSFHLGESQYPKVTLRVSAQVWRQIWNGEITWEKAMMERLFLATGNFPLVAQMPVIFKIGKA